jgi:hypothetical protein
MDRHEEKLFTVEGAHRKVLSALAGGAPLTIECLHRRTGLTRHFVWAILDRGIRLGLVTHSTGEYTLSGRGTRFLDLFPLSDDALPRTCSKPPALV